MVGGDYAPPSPSKSKHCVSLLTRTRDNSRDTLSAPHRRRRPFPARFCFAFSLLSLSLFLPLFPFHARAVPPQAFPERHLTVMLFKEVTNSAEIHAKLLSRTLEPELALLNPAPLASLFHLQLAAHKVSALDSRARRSVCAPAHVRVRPCACVYSSVCVAFHVLCCTGRVSRRDCFLGASIASCFCTLHLSLSLFFTPIPSRAKKKKV